jgi:hypothetical protein
MANPLYGQNKADNKIDMGKRSVKYTASGLTLVAADSGMALFVNLAADTTITLPSAAKGLHFEINVAKTGGSYDLEIVSPSATNYFYGGVIHDDSNADDVSIASDYNSNDYLTLLVAQPGSQVILYCDGTLWYVSGQVASATPPAFADSTGL